VLSILLSPADVPDIARVNFIVGLITEAKMHPDADSLYVETSRNTFRVAIRHLCHAWCPYVLMACLSSAVDIGEPEPRTVISGLAKYVPLEQMQNRLIVLCANLKPRK
jgi:tRNA-binding EMAP/Myf-like protein